jgi:hypothetical protein
MEYDVLWSGAHRDVYLCARDPEPLKVPTPKPWIERTRVYESRQALKAQVLSLLAERPRWSVRELRETLQADRLALHGVIQRGCAAGEIARVSYGCVRLVHRRRGRGKAAA